MICEVWVIKFKKPGAERWEIAFAETARTRKLAVERANFLASVSSTGAKYQVVKFVRNSGAKGV